MYRKNPDILREKVPSCWYFSGLNYYKWKKQSIFQAYQSQLLALQRSPRKSVLVAGTPTTKTGKILKLKHN